jgi:hypothetical protein
VRSKSNRSGTNDGLVEELKKKLMATDLMKRRQFYGEIEGATTLRSVSRRHCSRVRYLIAGIVLPGRGRAAGLCTSSARKPHPTPQKPHDPQEATTFFQASSALSRNIGQIKSEHLLLSTLPLLIRSTSLPIGRPIGSRLHSLKHLSMCACQYHLHHPLSRDPHAHQYPFQHAPGEVHP